MSKISRLLIKTVIYIRIVKTVTSKYRRKNKDCLEYRGS